MNRLPSLPCVRCGCLHFLFRCKPNSRHRQRSPRLRRRIRRRSPRPAAREGSKEMPTKKRRGNPFAPEPAPALPPGMTGSDANDPRAKLAPGLYDAGEAADGHQAPPAAQKAGRVSTRDH